MQEKPAARRLRGARRRRSRKRRRRRRIGVWRVVRWLVTALVAWLLVSLVLFLVSAQIQSAKVSDAADTELSGGGYPLTSPNTILVLGSDARVEGHQGGGRERRSASARARTRSC